MNVVYLHGFASGPTSSKAQFFARNFAALGIHLEIPDLAAGDFEHLTITGQLGVIDAAVASRGVTLIGSSMGGYLASLYAARHANVERLVLMAPAFGFIRHWREALGSEAMAAWADTGRRSVFHYGEGRYRELSYDLMTDGEKYEGFPDVSQPTLIFHGRNDPTVPIEFSIQFASEHPNATVIQLESGHELTDVIGSTWNETASFLNLADEDAARTPYRDAKI